MPQERKYAMNVNRAELKRMAKEDIRYARPHPALVTLVYLIITAVLTTLSMKINGQIDAMATAFTSAATGASYSAASYAAMGPSGLGSLLSIAIWLVLLMVSLGFTIYSLQLTRHRAVGFANLLDGFSFFLRYLALTIISSIFIALWSLLLIFPGIIASYRYRMAVYLMLDNPQMGVMDCLRESKRLMHGHKGELFVLDLSFLGWAILSCIPFVSLWTMPYMETTYAHYYQWLVGIDPTEAYPRASAQKQQERKKQDPWD